MNNIAFFWSVTQIVFAVISTLLTKHYLDAGADPLQFSYMILLFGGGYLFLYNLITMPRELFSLDRKSLFFVILIGLIAGAITYALGNIGLSLSRATNYAFLSQTSVFFTPILAFFLLRESLTWKKCVLIFTLLFGAYLISIDGEGFIPQVGDFFIVSNSLAFSFGTILAKMALRKIPVLTFSAYRALFGGLWLLLYLLLVGRFDPHIAWGPVAITGITVSMGILSMNKVLEHASTSYMQMMCLFIPVLIALFAHFVFGETMSLIQLIGGGIIIGSGWWIHRLKL